MNVRSSEISIPVDARLIRGVLQIPDTVKGLVLFAHGSGSSRYSPRNRFVADALNAAGLATMLIDLLTEDEEAIDGETMQFRFDIGLLAGRLVAATRWAREERDLRGLVYGYFGASTGAAAALDAAAILPDQIAAIVSRSGRPDLASHLAEVRAPTLLIVGGADLQVLVLNRRALGSIRTECRLTVIPGATHLFEESGTLAEVAELATSWFLQHFNVPARS